MEKGCVGSTYLNRGEAEKKVKREADERARQILKEVPAWIPAKVHGHKKTDCFGYAEVAL